MSSYRIPSVVPALATFSLLALGGCVESDPLDEFDPFGASSDESVLRSEDPFYEGACPDVRVIAKPTDPTACPDIIGWHELVVLQEGSEYLQTHPTAYASTAPVLCQYVWNTAVPKPIALAALNQAKDVDGLIDDVKEDCKVVRAQWSSVITDETNAELYDIFHDQIDWVSATEIGAGEPLRQGVTVAVIDTMPWSPPEAPRSMHGENMARIIEDVACPPNAAGTCAVHVERVLGLPRYPGGVDLVNGGYLGSYKDLATAIVEAVDRWKTAYPSEKLIINLSVGWDGNLFDATEGGVTPPNIAIVRDAIRYARCRGAAVIAAAGNANDMCTDGPLYPAAWETMAAPTDADCTAHGIVAPQTGGGSYRPLVHSVGGAHLHYDVMPGTRVGGMPRLAATATHVVIDDEVAPTTPMTGTSVAAAVTSGAAALIWSFDPSLSPADLMQRLHDSGNPVGAQTADYALGDPAAQPLRRLDVCNALADACAANPTPACAALSLDCAPPPAPASLANLVSDVDAMPIDATDGPYTNEKTCAPDIWCDPATAYMDAGLTCGNVQVDPTEYFLSPQPDSPPCPNCTLTIESVPVSDSHVRGALDSYYADRAYGIDWIMVTLSDGATRTSFDFRQVDLTVNDVLDLRLDPSLVPENVVSARIDVKFDTLNWPVGNELIYEPE